MDMLEAMRDTIDTARLRGWGNMEFDDPSLSCAHAEGMLDRVISNVDTVTGRVGFSEGKLGRWLGWVQCAAVSAGCLTLDEAKKINQKYA